MPQNLSEDEVIAFQNFSKNKNLIIQKSDKVNSMVNVDRQNYTKKMGNVLIDQEKLTRVNLKDGTLLNFTVNQESHVDKVLKKLVESNSMTEKKQDFVKTCRYQTRWCYVPINNLISV